MIPAAHKKFADHAASQLEADPRFLGLAAAGSWISGQLDEFSDLDLVLVVDPGRLSSVLQDREQIIQSMGPCLAAFPGDHVGVPNLSICLYEDPLLHVDLKFVALDDFSQRIENPVVIWERDSALTKVMEESKPHHEQHDLQWMEDRFWTWIHYGAQRLGRGEIFEVLDMLAFLRSRVLGPLLSARSSKPPRSVRRVEKFASQEDLKELQSTVAAYDARSCEQALKNAAKMYVGLRETLAPMNLKRNRRAEMASLRYLHEVSEKL